ncbi:hypothetical protein BDW62DRAFT_179416 [Aspergillus aurantiobrunneus]
MAIPGQRLFLDLFLWIQPHAPLYPSRANSAARYQEYAAPNFTMMVQVGSGSDVSPILSVLPVLPFTLICRF